MATARWPGLATVAALAITVLSAPVEAAETAPPTGWGEPHLHRVPRTKAEAARIAAITDDPADFTAPEPFEERPAGAATHFDTTTATPFSLPSANLAPERGLDFRVGHGFFEKLWVAAPTATTASDGLGPLYNARGCKSCHVRDGRGHPPEGPDDNGVSMVLKLSQPGDPAAAADLIRAHLATLPDPTYGNQLQDRSLPGLPAEGRLAIDWTPVPVTLGDGTVVTLRKPAYSVTDPGYGPLDPQTVLSARVAPQMIGLGLLEAIPEADILALADPEDSDGDGISGRPNRVWSLEYGQWMLGRFGWKAAQPTVAQQGSDAFVTDIGISTPLHPVAWGDCTAAEPACRAAPHGQSGNDEGLEIPSVGLDLVSFYTRNLAVPARRDLDDPQVLQGKRLFHEAGCAACHRPKFVTHRLQDRPEQSFQLIWPYTDLLLHDMGPGLADARTEFAAEGAEWRTAPLWGIGLTEQVSGHTHFLHDGRARSLLEAILWHGGEAKSAREAVRTLPEGDRAALIAFLNSL
ncbi:di-heme oxidoredictase family protein [Tropicimonas sp. IMCC34043]|uniref:di-heme oxidoreductase family protein n=1 Tax=Tropicimonas sp. IMCC34043 TaxID=2248760 RepID=UPI0035137E1A